MRRLLAVIAATAILVGGVSYLANAAIPSADGTFTACINKTSGAVRIIDTATSAKCASNENQRTWNAQGRPGTDGLLGTYVTEERDSDTGNVIDFMWCDEGDFPVSGNFAYTAEPGSGLDSVGSMGYDDPVRGRAWMFFASSDVPGEPVSGRWSLNCLDTALPAHTP